MYKFRMYQALASFAFNNINEYIYEMESYIVSKRKKITNQFEEELRKITDENEYEEIEEHYSELLFPYRMAFPEILRSSVVATVYTTFEKHIKDICLGLNEELMRENKDKLQKKGMSDLGKYLNGVIKSDLSEKTLHEWEQLLNGYRLIRNNFAHNGGIVTKDDDLEVLKLNKEGIQFYYIDDVERKIILQQGFCEELSHKCFRFIWDVTRVLDDKFKK